MNDSELLPIEKRGCGKRTEIEKSREEVLRDFLGEERAPSVFADLHPQAQKINQIVNDILTACQKHCNSDIDAIRSIWIKTVGRDIAAECAPEFFKDGILTVSVSNPSWKFVLERQHKKILTEKLRQNFSSTLQDIKFILKHT